MVSSAGWAVARRRVLASSGSLAPRGLILRHALPSVRMISISASMRVPAAKPKSKSAASKTTKKPATKKAATKPTAKPKAKAKAKAKPKPKKKVVKKVVKKKAVKKELTPEEKEKVEVRTWKKMALLKGPKQLPETAWNVFLASSVQKGEGSIISKIKTLSTSFHTLPESEKERLSTIARSNRIANQQARKDWIETYPPEAIYVSNLMRRRLARKTGKSRIFLIHDDRMPQRSGGVYPLFMKDFLAGSEEKSTQDSFRAASKEWKSLNEADKNRYKEQAAAAAKTSVEQFKGMRERGLKFWKDYLASSKDKSIKESS